MLYKDKEGLKLSTSKVRYTQNGEETEQDVGVEGESWWTAFAEKWDNIQITGFADVSYTPEQLARFEKVKEIEASEEILSDYVMNGTFPEGLEHPLRNLQIEKDLADMFYEIMLGGM